MNDNLIMHISNEGKPNSDWTGGGSPSYFAARRRLMINHMNIII